MNQYPVHSIESAPERSKPALAGLKQQLGLIPNLAATMAESPVLLLGFVGAFGNFHGGTFTPAQKQALLLSNAVANRCAWAVAFHSTMALEAGVDPDDVQALRDERAPREPKLAALARFTRALIDQRGHVGADELGAFAEAGFHRDQALEVIAGLAVSVMANYAGNITQPNLESRFAAQSWHA